MKWGIALQKPTCTIHISEWVDYFWENHHIRRIKYLFFDILEIHEISDVMNIFKFFNPQFLRFPLGNHGRASASHFPSISYLRLVLSQNSKNEQSDDSWAISFIQTICNHCHHHKPIACAFHSHQGSSIIIWWI